MERGIEFEIWPLTYNRYSIQSQQLCGFFVCFAFLLSVLGSSAYSPLQKASLAV